MGVYWGATPHRGPARGHSARPASKAADTKAGVAVLQPPVSLGADHTDPSQCVLSVGPTHTLQVTLPHGQRGPRGIIPSIYGVPQCVSRDCHRSGTLGGPGSHINISLTD